MTPCVSTRASQGGHSARRTVSGARKLGKEQR